MSITHDTYAAAFGFPFKAGGGVTSARGFTAAGIHAGFRANPHRLDMAIVAAQAPCPTAAVFTRNAFCAAPVRVSRDRLGGVIGESYGTAQAVIVNSGNANAATGEEGVRTAEAAAEIVAEHLEIPPRDVLVASTGVIGVPLPLTPFRHGVPEAAAKLSREGGTDAACAIMTTDTVEKECAVTFQVENTTFTVGGMAKGSGMIMPDMATMIAVLTTDAPLAPAVLHKALHAATAASFNKVTVDSDSSTNDTCILMASGAAADTMAPFSVGSAAYEAFQKALTQVCVALARAMARDGEGASKLVTVHVRGAASADEADVAARAVANSPLVKTAVTGRDANWGRIAAALGKSGARFDQHKVDIDIMGLPVCRAGMAQPFDEAEARKRFENSEIVLEADLGAGEHAATLWTCDLTHSYIDINADYRS
ncbi:bifunctional glutamate N-acetyltransferase/amino-acid acetyltransferase ArgJ [Adlercreutzia murintestinalis]|uniref:bifunctional glutamate N-acetyltransferase/amino-acid acetyltransferase ArgJ n=1 Tax=Adlercreutzia murintestinalis TaxID=2941325 RepID=UPI00203E75D8|nr:bifunctional glutamate N-acetyltransferase/amino-acid acetyltransferase ArgJ [Adlercreutzia murintestinalis]